MEWKRWKIEIRVAFFSEIFRNISKWLKYFRKKLKYFWNISQQKSFQCSKRFKFFTQREIEIEIKGRDIFVHIVSTVSRRVHIRVHMRTNCVHMRADAYTFFFVETQKNLSRQKTAKKECVRVSTILKINIFLNVSRKIFVGDPPYFKN